VAAEINISHLLCWLGDFAGAKRYVDEAIRSSHDHLQLLLAALDSQANLLIATGDYQACHRVFDRMTELRGSAGVPVLHWDTLTERYSRARLAMAEGQWMDAHVQVAEGLKLALAIGDTGWARRMQLASVRCLGRMKAHSETGAELSRAGLFDDPHPTEIAEFAASVAASELRTDAAKQQLSRAIRICEGMQHEALAQELTWGASIVADWNDVSREKPNSDLDTAVALLELGGHPHLLGREALAVIEAAGCARRMALVAAAPEAPRVIACHGWDERQALAAARRPDGCDVVALGHYRDEPWQLVVEPEPGIEHRCTLVAIRKLIATSVTLDRYRREEKQRAALWPAEALDGDPESVWASEQVSEVLTVARRIAPTPLSVLLTGETGTGKEMLARVIHRASDRADKAFLPFNCTAVPRDMLESQLFGYRKGAFTGADAAFPGVIRSAAGGTLFLDEIAEIGLDVQPKLLRFLETHEIHPLAEPHPVQVDVRVIAATNAPLEQLVAEGRLREDLFYRLNVVRLKLPPLRERREEIPPLVEHYLRRFGDEQKKGRLTLSDEALEYLLLYAWPGNVRQLANEVRRMVAMAEPGATLVPAHLSLEIQASRRTIPAGSPSEPEVRVRLDQPLPDAVLALEQTMVRNALAKSHGRVEEAARLLGISRKGLFLKRRRWGLELPRVS
jgi:DNA-binding NtrC family response regulator